VSRVAALGVLAALIVALAGCGGEGDEAVQRLDELGFFDHANGAAREAAVAEVGDDPVAGVFAEGTRRFWFADAEDLTEGGAGTFLKELEPLLRDLGVPPLRLRDDFGDEPYSVTVNGTRYPIFTAAEGASDHIWGHAAARTVGIVNDLLRDAGSRERAYGYASAETNDFSVFVLTPALRDAVAEILGADGPDAPYEVRNEPPSFGYPHWEDAFGVGP
jgi:hypothetical protein